MRGRPQVHSINNNNIISDSPKTDLPFLAAPSQAGFAPDRKDVGRLKLGFLVSRAEVFRGHILMLLSGVIARVCVDEAQVLSVVYFLFHSFVLQNFLEHFYLLIEPVHFLAF